MARKILPTYSSIFTSIRSRMFLGAIGLAILFILALWAFRQTTMNTREKLYEAVWVYAPLQSNAQKVLVYLEQYRQHVQDLAYNTDTTQRGIKLVRIEKLWKEGIQTCLDSLKKSNSKLRYTKLQDLYKSLIFKLEKHQKYINKLKSQVNQGSYYIYLPQDNKFGSNKRLYAHVTLGGNIPIYIQPQIDEIRELIGECEQTIQILQVSQEYDDQNLNPFSSWFFWGFWIAGVLACLWWLWQVRLMHREDIELLRTFPKMLGRGEIPTAIEPQLAEHKELAHTLNSLVRPLTDLKVFAQELNKDHIKSSQTKLFGNQGELGKALSQMREAIAKDAKENEIRNITNTGLAKFADIFAKYTNNLAQLSDAFLENLVNYLNANQGGLFLLEIQSGTPFLELKAAFAYDQKRYMDRIIEPGQGLIGQVWKEGESSYIRDIPQFYVNITSGLGEATPNALLIVPLKTGTSVLGVLEIASFHEILPYQREFVEKVAENLAQVIANSQQAEQTKFLLQESQALAYSLQSREEELKEKMQALQVAQTTMETTKIELEIKENNLQGLINNTSHAIIAFDRLYKITVINKAMRQMYLEQNISLELGKNFLEEMPQNEFAKRHKDFFRVLAGEKFVTLERVERGGRISYYELHYNPILNDEKDVLGASIFIENITQQKMAEVYLKETEANLHSLINNTTDAIMAIDKDFNLLVFNDVYAKQFAEKGYQLQRNKPIFNYLTYDKQAEWREYYQRALAGERFSKVLDSGVFPHKIYVEHSFNPIREDGEVVGISVFARDITETRKAEIANKQTLLESLEETQRLKQQAQSLEQELIDCQRKLEDIQSSPS